METMTNEILERTIPVSDTALKSLGQLTADGDEDGAAFSEKLGLTYEGMQTFGSNRMSREDMCAFRMVLEVRYQTMEHAAQEFGYNAIVGLPCGYTCFPSRFHEAESAALAWTRPWSSWRSKRS